MPNPDLPHTTQAGVCGNVKDVESIAGKSSFAVKMPVSASAFTSIKADSNVSRRAYGQIITD